MIARVSTEVQLDQLFDYSVPVAMREQLRVGQRVMVNLGQRKVSAFVIEVVDTGELPSSVPPPSAPPAPSVGTLPGFAPPPAAAHPRMRLKSILEILEPEPFITPKLLQLARWMAGYFCAPLETTLRSLLPAAVRNREVQARQLFYVTPHVGDFTLTERQRELHTHLLRVGGGWLQSLTREFKCTTQTLRALEARAALTIEKRQRRRDPLANRRILPTQPLKLMPEQAAALTAVVAAIDQVVVLAAPQECEGEAKRPTGSRPHGPKPLLLLGVTGSGKTEVYLQAIAHVLELGGGAIVLVPEIALTPQTVQRFAARFGERIAVLHSALSDGERFDEWHRIRSGAARVVIGPRSALFAPVKRLGLIVVDEEHEPSYKQDEAPRYGARDVAVMRGALEGCAVVLGSATPSLESWHNALSGKYQLARIEKRVEGRAMPHVKVVDMRQESAAAGHAQIFSEQLLEALKLRLERGEQSILFLNRRGYATSLQCTKCGYVAECQACDVAYTYHQHDTCLRCHVCGAWQLVPPKCPGCADPSFRYAGIGTQRVEVALQRCFPQARVLRMDADVTTRKQSHDEILGVFRSGRADILLGTQMIAKGLDFPNVTLVGVLMADSSLHQPDFRAAERTYQLLAQVSGRAGRAELPGEVFVQTYSPHHYAVRAAAQGDYDQFAKRELTDRQRGHYPPFTRMVVLTFRGTSEERVRLTSESFAQELRSVISALHGERAVIFSEVAPAPLARAKGLYRYQLLLRAIHTATITRPLRTLLTRTQLPADVMLAVDVDAVSMG